MNKFIATAAILFAALTSFAAGITNWNGVAVSTATLFSGGSVGFASRNGAIISAGGGGGGAATDNFDSYADASNLDAAADWVNLDADALFIDKPSSDGSIYATHSDGYRMVRHTSTRTDDQYSEATVEIDSLGFMGVGVAVRCQSGADSCYAFTFLGNNTATLMKQISNTESILASDLLALSDGDKIRLEVTGTGATTRLNAYTDTGSGWVLHGTFTDIDPGSTYLNDGFTGVSSFGTGDTIRLDDWEGGDL